MRRKLEYMNRFHIDKAFFSYCNFWLWDSFRNGRHDRHVHKYAGLLWVIMMLMNLIVLTN
jgi:hypothetical protein